MPVIEEALNREALVLNAEAAEHTMADQTDVTTILIFAGRKRSGEIVHEEIPVQHTSGGNYVVLASPGLAQGVAKGDLIQITDGSGKFSVLERGRNVCVQIFCKNGLAALEKARSSLDGWGIIDGAETEIIVVTFPVDLGFAKIESVVNEICSAIGADGWQYGNIYAEDDDESPLNWWM